MKDNITETTEKLYNTLKKYISVHTNIPQDIRQQFEKITDLRKAWQKELRGGATDHWIEIELGVSILFGQHIELSTELLPAIVRSIRKSLPKKTENLMKNPFDLYAPPYLPIPSEYILQDTIWNEETLTLRYYYTQKPEITKELIRKWWNSWDNYPDFIGYVWLNEEAEKGRKEQEWVDEADITSFEGESEHHTRLFISRIRTSDGICYSLGHSVKTGLLSEPNCEKLKQFAGKAKKIST